MICCLVIDDGRADYLTRCLSSLHENAPRFDHRRVVYDPDHRLGFAGAIEEGWNMVLDSGVDWVFHVESDFLFNGPIPIEQMLRVFDANPNIAQVSLKRQAWNEREIEAGGIVEADPDDFTEKRKGDLVWTEHRKYFTTNPSLYRVDLCKRGWPQVKHSEGVFTHQLLEDPKLRFAIYGGKYAPPLVEHIGTARAGHGY